MTTVTSSPIPEIPTAHATINGIPRSVLVAARALGHNAEELRMLMSNEAADRLADALSQIEPLPEI